MRTRLISGHGFALAWVTVLALAWIAGQATPSTAQPFSVSDPAQHRPSPTVPFFLADNARWHRRLIVVPDGDLQLRFLDVMVPSETLPLMITRDYRSGSAEEGIFGRGWISNLDVRLTDGEGTGPEILEANGHRSRYRADGPGRFAPAAAPAIDHILKKMPDGGWRRSWSNGLEEDFDRRGRRTSMASSNDRLLFYYRDDTSLQPSVVSDAKGRNLELAYADGLLSKVTDPLRRTTRYWYQDRQLSEVVDAVRRKATFSYASGRLAQLTLPNRATVKVLYAADGRVREIAGPGAMKTEFAWQAAADTEAVQLTATLTNGSRETFRFAMAPLAFKDWNLTDPAYAGVQGKTVGLQITASNGAGESTTALAVGGKILLRQDNTPYSIGLSAAGELTLFDRKQPKPEDLSALVAAADPDPEWRSLLIPAIIATRIPDAEHDRAGRVVKFPIDADAAERWIWDDADRLTQWTDIGGSVTRYEYDALDRLVRIINDGETVASSEYDEMGFLAWSVNAGGANRRYTHDAAGNLESAVDEEGRVYRYGYDSGNRLIEQSVDGTPAIRLQYDETGRLTRLTQPGGAFTEFRYGPDGSLLEEIDEKGARTTYRYDSQGRLIAASYPDGQETSAGRLDDGWKITVKDAKGQLTAREYDQAGRLRRLELPNLPEYRFSYRDDGRLLSVADSAGGLRKFNYDRDGRLTSETDAKGGGTRFSYDGNGRLTGYDAGDERSAFTYEPDAGLSIASRDGKQTTRLRYDVKGRLLAYSDPAGTARTYQHGLAGLQRITSGDNETLRYDYDLARRVTALTYDAAGQAATVKYKYDDKGNLSELTHEDGTIETYRYDAQGRLIERINRVKGVFRYAYDEAGRIAHVAGPSGSERFEYDGAGRLTKHEDPVEGVFQWIYAEDGNTVTIVDPRGMHSKAVFDEDGRLLTMTDALGGRISRRYDSGGRPVAKIDPNGSETTWSYDDRDRLIEARTQGGKIFRYEYDDQDRLIESGLPGNITIKQKYDALGRLATLAATGGSKWDYGYDAAGRLSKLKGASGTASYAYDALDRLIHYRDASGAAARVAYDVAGRPQFMELPDKSKVAYSYDATGLLAGIATSPGAEIGYAYEANGRLSAIAYPNGLRISYRYVAGNRIQSITTTNATGSVVLAETYEYDERGNVVAIMSEGMAPTGGTDLGPRFGRTEYRYDALNRIIESAFPDGVTERFTYDAAGNITEFQTVKIAKSGIADQKVVQYRYDADQALIGQDGRLAPPDANGNLCLEGPKAGCITQYDAFNRLTAWSDQTYAYDGEGRLVRWRDKGGGGNLIYFDSLLVGEADIEGSVARTYVPGIQYGLWSAMRVGDADYFPIRSANGSLLAIADKNGAFVQTCRYRTFAADFAWAANGENARCEFAGGRQLGPGTWFGSRVLSPAGMRFMSPDAAGPDKDGNIYSYALGNPLRFTDLTGTASTPLAPMTPMPEFRKPIIRELWRVARSPPGTPGKDVAQGVIDQLRQKTLIIEPVSSIPSTTGKPVYGFSGSGKTAYVSVGAAQHHEFIFQGVKGAEDVTTIRVLTGATVHEAAHVEQNLAANELRRLHELEAEFKRWKYDPKMGTQKVWSLQDVIDSVVENYKGIGGHGIGDREINAVTGEGVESIVVREKYVFEGVAEEVDSLKHPRMELTLDVQRIPSTGPKEPLFPKSSVERAVAREATIAEKAAGKLNAIRNATQRAIDANAKVHDAVLGKAQSAAKKAYERVAPHLSKAGRFAKYTLPAIGQILAAKDIVDATIWAGQTAGETAADAYIRLKKARDAILNPLDALGKKIDEAGQPGDPRKKKPRRGGPDATSPETALLGGSGGGEPPQQSASVTPGEAGAAGGTASGLGPQTPLGGSQASLPQSGDATQDKPDLPANQPPAKPPGGLGPNVPLGGESDQLPDSSTGEKPDALPQTEIDLIALCTADYTTSSAATKNARLIARNALGREGEVKCSCITFLSISASMGNKIGRPISEQCKLTVASADPLPEKQEPTADPKPSEEKAPQPEPPASETTEQAAAQPASPPEQEGLAPPSVPDFMKPGEAAPEPREAPPTPPAPEPAKTAATPPQPLPQSEKIPEPPSGQMPSGSDKVQPRSQPSEPKKSGGLFGGLVDAYNAATEKLDWLAKQIGLKK